MFRLQRILRLAGTLGLALLVAPAVVAQGYPTGPVKLVVGAPAGGTTDVLARIVAPKLSAIMGQQFVVENRAGASGIIAADAVAKAPADGYTLLFSSSLLATNQALYPNTPFDAAKDFEPISLIAYTPYVLVVHPSLPVKTVNELVDYAKAHPNKINYAASAPGGGQHLAWEMLKRNTGTEMVYVPYKGTGALMPDLLSGRLHAGIDNVTILTQYIRSGALRALAVTGASRSPLLPDVPTAIESGMLDFTVVGWFGIFAPAKTPAPVIQRLAGAIQEVLQQKETSDRLTELGAQMASPGPDALRTFLATEMQRWGKLIRDAGIVVQ